MPGVMTPGDIHVGLGEIYIGVDVPATPPVTLAGGVPGSGRFIGGTLSPCKFNMRPKELRIMTQQDTGPVDVVLIEEEITVEFEVAEFTFQNLKDCLLGAKDGGTFVTFGGRTVVPKLSVLLVSPFRNKPNIYIETMIYAGVFGGQPVIEFARERETRINVTVTSTSFLQARDLGDRMGFIHPNVSG